MKTILVFVQSIDSKVTKWGHPVVKTWSSKEDQDYFTELMKKSKLTVIGINTFNVDQIKPRQGHLMVVMTHRPSDYRSKEVPGQLEFTDQSPAELVERFQKEGFTRLLMVGGPKVATSFLRQNQVDEIWLTVEPVIFGTGGTFVTEEVLNIQLRLLSSEPMNRRGTLLLKYKVTKQ